MTGAPDLINLQSLLACYIVSIVAPDERPLVTHHTIISHVVIGETIRIVCICEISDRNKRWPTTGDSHHELAPGVVHSQHSSGAADSLSRHHDAVLLRQVVEALCSGRDVPANDVFRSQI